MCEGCGLTHPSFGIKEEGKIRWCGHCAKDHSGAVRLGTPFKMCE
eukprot:SAG31_NODE_4188_length_3491_cov_1.981427_1_plen_44_part_10